MPLRTIVRRAAAPLALLAFTGAYYHGDRASIDFPDGWSTPEKDSDGVVSSKTPGGTANCNVQTKDLPGIADSTLSQINADYAHVFSAADWADFLGVKTADLTVLNSELRPFADAYFHIATLRVNYQGTVAMVRYGFYVLPGRATMTGCYSTVADYPTYTAIFDKAVTSLRPW